LKIIRYLIDRRFLKMGVEEIVVNVAREFVYSDFTKKNRLGAVVGALATVGTVGTLGVAGTVTSL
jgi:hypothetical protein